MTPNLDEDRVERAARAIEAAELDWKAANGGDSASCVDCPDEVKARAAITAYLGDTHVDVSRGDLEYIASESSQSLIRDRARGCLTAIPTVNGKGE